MQADDTSELAVQLGHILDHICKAWNARDRSPEQMAAVAQAEHDRMCNTVPNFHAESAGAVWLFCLPEASQLLAGEFSERKRMHVAPCAKAFSRYQAFQP